MQVLIDDLQCTLVDEGTLDTAVEVYDHQTGQKETFRFSGEVAAEYRDESGAFDHDSFANFCADWVKDDAEQFFNEE